MTMTRWILACSAVLGIAGCAGPSGGTTDSLLSFLESAPAVPELSEAPTAYLIVVGDSGPIMFSGRMPGHSDKRYYLMGDTGKPIERATIFAVRPSGWDDEPAVPFTVSWVEGQWVVIGPLLWIGREAQGAT